MLECMKGFLQSELKLLGLNLPLFQYIEVNWIWTLE